MRRIRILVLKPFKFSINFFHSRASIDSSLKLENLLLMFRLSKSRFGYDLVSRLFYWFDSETKWHFTTKRRGFNFYRSGGINFCSKLLCKAYSIDLIQIDYNDVILDCGANWGDIYPEISKKNKIEYHAFEPSKEDYDVLRRNVPGQKINNLALGDNNCKKIIYLDVEGASSSLIQNQNKSAVNEVEVVTIDTYVRTNKIGFIKLIKVEAEGYEPEVLNGSFESLKKTHYVAVDAGPERGPLGLNTVEDVEKILKDNQFELLSRRGYHLLFINKNII